MNIKIDSYLSRASHIAQIILVTVAVYGYFYTVIPIYQKDLLSENIAQKELELNSLKAEILDLNNIKVTAENDLARVLEEKRITDQIITNTNKELKKAKQNADNAYKEIYIESFTGATAVPWMNLSLQGRYRSGDYTLTPYDVILEVLKDGNPESLESARIIPQRIKDEMNVIIKNKLEEQKSDLSKKLSDTSTTQDEMKRTFEFMDQF